MKRAKIERRATRAKILKQSKLRLGLRRTLIGAFLAKVTDVPVSELNVPMILLQAASKDKTAAAAEQQQQQQRESWTLVARKIFIGVDIHGVGAVTPSSFMSELLSSSSLMGKVPSCAAIQELVRSSMDVQLAFLNPCHQDDDGDDNLDKLSLDDVLMLFHILGDVWLDLCTLEAFLTNEGERRERELDGHYREDREGRTTTSTSTDGFARRHTNLLQSNMTQRCIALGTTLTDEMEDTSETLIPAAQQHHYHRWIRRHSTNAAAQDEEFYCCVCRMRQYELDQLRRSRQELAHMKRWQSQFHRTLRLEEMKLQELQKQPQQRQVKPRTHGVLDDNIPAHEESSGQSSHDDDRVTTLPAITKSKSRRLQKKKTTKELELEEDATRGTEWVRFELAKIQ